MFRILQKILLFIIFSLCFLIIETNAQLKELHLKYDEKGHTPVLGYYQLFYTDTIDANRFIIEFYNYQDKLIKVIPYFNNQIDGVVYAFDSLGNLQSEANYLGGIINGFYNKYWPNGKLKRKELYIDGSFVSGLSYNISGQEVKFRKESSDFVIAGGVRDLNDYIQKHISYPFSEMSKGVEGKVVVAFTVTEFCTVEDVRITKSVSETIDLLAMKMIREMHIESPQIRNGIPERVTIWLPIIYGSDE